MLLTIELIPSSAWSKNLRLLPREIWDSTRQAALEKASYHCEVCGVGPPNPKGAAMVPAQSPAEASPVLRRIRRRAIEAQIRKMADAGYEAVTKLAEEAETQTRPNQRLECHEAWSYCLQGLPPRKVQKLIGVVVLCPDCHAVKHMARTKIVHGPAVAELALRHLADVNGWTLSQARRHKDDAFERWRVRDEFLWEVDLTLFGGGRLEADSSYGDSYERTFGPSLSARLQSKCDAWHAASDPPLNTDDFWIRAEGPAGDKQTGRYSGKWCVFRANVDELWSKIAIACEAGKLGTGAKVSTAPDGSGSHVICVFTADCRDEDDVRRVIVALRALGVSECLRYKEDGATAAGVYGRGASLYVSQPASLTFERRRDIIPVADAWAESENRVVASRPSKARESRRG